MPNCATLRLHWMIAFWLHVDPEPLIGTNDSAFAGAPALALIPDRLRIMTIDQPRARRRIRIRNVIEIVSSAERIGDRRFEAASPGVCRPAGDAMNRRVSPHRRARGSALRHAETRAPDGAPAA